MKNTESLCMYAKEKSIKTELHVIEVINAMVKNKEKITFYSVYKEARVSKSFVYKNMAIRKIIEIYRKKPNRNNQSQDSKDIIIELQKREINELKKEVKALKRDELLIGKVENLQKENKELKKQLEKSYSY